MENQTKILFLTANTTFSKLLSFSLQTNFNFDISQYSESSPIESIMDSSSNYFLIVCDGSASHDQIKSCLEKAKFKGLKIPIIVLGTDSFLKELKNYKAIFVDRENAIKNVEDSVKQLFIEHPTVKPLEYCPVQFKVLTAFEELHCDVYIKMISGRYLKIFREKDTIVKEDVMKYEKKGVESLYLKKATAFWILKELKDNYSNTYNTLEQGEKFKIDSPPTGIDDNDNEEKEKRVGKDTGADYSLKKKVYGQNPVASKDDDNVDSLASAIADLKNHADAEEQEKISKQIDGTFKLSSEFKEDIEKKVRKAVGIMAKNKNVKGLLKKLKVDRNPDQYFKIHVNLLCKLTVAIANILEWNTESTLEKLVYVSYMHDITLLEHPHLARIQNMEQFKQMEDQLPDDEIKLFLNHPEDIKLLVEKTKGHPIEADTIIYQHHELPSGEGFPNKVSTTRILPLSALFIIAHDLCNYILEHPKWDIDTYVKRCQDKYKGANFTKIIRRLSELKK